MVLENNDSLRYLLLPFSLLYGIIIAIRNLFYDWKILHSESPEIPIIKIGNLTTGGSGKTPHAEFILRILMNKGIHPILLSRGYGRQTNGFRHVNISDNAVESGDEPLQIARKFKEIPVILDEKRVQGIQKGLELFPQTQCFVLDDAFQHRNLASGFAILLFDYQDIYKNKFLLPAGNYREGFGQRKRAQAFVVSKCPDSLPENEKLEIVKKLSESGEQPVFFSRIQYGSIKSLQNFDLFSGNLKEYDCVVLTGIAKAEPFISKCKESFAQVQMFNFGDHHVFTEKEILKVKQEFEKIPNSKKLIITTEKDSIRLHSPELQSLIQDLPIYFWEIEVKLLSKEKEFTGMILQAAGKKI